MKLWEKLYWSRILPYLTVVLLGYYVLPLVVVALPNSVVAGLFWLPLLVANPLIVFLANFGYAVKYGWNSVVPLLTAVVFLPAIYSYYNDSAVSYLVIYLGLALIGMGVGKIVKICSVDPYRETHDFDKL